MSEKSLAIIVAASPLALIVGVFVAPNDTGSLLGRMAAVLSDLVYLILLIIAGLTALRVNFLIVAAVTALVYTVLVALTNYDLNVRLGSFPNYYAIFLYSGWPAAFFLAIWRLVFPRRPFTEDAE